MSKNTSKLNIHIDEVEQNIDLIIDRLSILDLPLSREPGSLILKDQVIYGVDTSEDKKVFRSQKAIYTRIAIYNFSHVEKYSTEINRSWNLLIAQSSKTDDFSDLVWGETFFSACEIWMLGTLEASAEKIQKEREYFESIYNSESLVRSAMDTLDLSKYITVDILNEAWENYQKIKHLDNFEE